MSTTSPILASVNGLMASATISSLLSQGFRVKGTIGPYDDGMSFARQYPEAAASIPWARLPYLGAPDAFDDELADVDYVVHATSGGFLILQGRLQAEKSEKRRRRERREQLPLLKALSAYSRGIEIDGMRTPTLVNPLGGAA